MARPRGFSLSRPAFTDLTLAKRVTMSEVAASSGMPLTTLSGLVNGNHRASIKTVRQLADGLGCSPATLFPELIGTTGDVMPEAVA